MDQAEAQGHAVPRRCAMVRENGEPCRGTPALGESYCHAHARYQDALMSIAMLVPLVDDEASITFVRSQAIRAMALGTIPPENGHAMLAGCRDAERRLDRRLAVQNAAMRYAALAEKIGVETLRARMAEFLEMQLPAAGCQLPAISDQRAVISEKPGIREQGSGISEGELPASGGQRVEEQPVAAAVQRGASMGWQAGESWCAWQERRKAAFRTAEEAGEAHLRLEEQAAAGDEMPENSEQRSASGEGERSAVSDQRSGNSDEGSVIGSGEQPASGQDPTLSPTAGDKGGARRDQAPQPVMFRSIFPDVKEQWEDAVHRTEGKIAAVICPKEGESWYDFLPRKRERDAAIAAMR